MKVTGTLYRQHIGRMFTRHWFVASKKQPTETRAEEHLKSLGITVIDPQNIGKPAVTEKLETEPRPGNWHEKPCYTFKDQNVLLEGVAQTQVLLNALKVNGLPEKIQDFIGKLKIPIEVERAMHHGVLSACVFDAQQEKLGYKIKDPDRPMYVFPRTYGITDNRKNQLLYLRLAQNCEKLAKSEDISNRRFIQDVPFKVPFKKDDNQVQLNLTAETFLVSRKPLSRVGDLQKLKDLEIPNIFPLTSTVSMDKTNAYDLELSYPIRTFKDFSSPHTILLHFSPLDVKNKFETPVLDTQFESRAMMKAFAVAASRAKTQFGEDVLDLPQPIVVQVVQSDTKRYQFGVFQLNSLNLNEGHTVKNIWYSSDIINLYEECKYKVGKPVLEGYNKDVLRHMVAFYNSS